MTVDEIVSELIWNSKYDRVVVQVTTKDSTTGEVTVEDFDIDSVDVRKGNGNVRIHITNKI